MGLLSLAHGTPAHRADFVLYGTATLLNIAALLGAAPPGHGWWLAACGAAGLVAWSGIEYALHHERPTALTGTPTLLTATLFATLAFLPALALSDLWTACALALGLLVGHLGYGITHHALHHSRGDSAWLRSLKRWHALHHRAAEPCCHGVTSPFRDHVFGSVPKRREVRQRTDTHVAMPYNPAPTDAPPTPRMPDMKSLHPRRLPPLQPDRRVAIEVTGTR